MPKGAPRNGPRGANESGTGHGPGADRAAGSVEGAANAGGSHHEGSQQPPLVDEAGTADETAANPRIMEADGARATGSGFLV